MVELNITTTTIYEDVIFNCRIDNKNVQTEFNSCISKENVFIKTPSDKDKIKDNIPQDCLLDLEVVRPYPDITVDVSNKELKKDDSIDYSFWEFKSEREFEEWFEDNNLELVEKA